MKPSHVIVALLLMTVLLPRAQAATRPNIFIAISDDQSWPHTSAYGATYIQTPHFDRVATEGVLFNNAFCASPGCSPSRAALLTGRNTWQIEHAGTHASYFDPKYVTFPERLAETGYHTGSTGKGWGPGNFKKLGRKHNPAGPSVGAKGGYAASFAKFLGERPQDKPFCFWFGSTDPHRGYKKGSGLAKGKRLEDVQVPSFLPDTPEIRSDLLDYAYEVERFDDDLGKMLALLEQAGQIDNTLIIVTSDNGIPVPRAKANCYEYGIHMPLAIRWGDRIPRGRHIDDLVGFTDLTATLYEAAAVTPPQAYPLVGKSILAMLQSEKSGRLDAGRTAVYAARERHSSSRYNSLSYPQRCIRTAQYLYILNLKHERWPAGPAQKYNKATYDTHGNLGEFKLGSEHGAYHDIDACPTLDYLIDHCDDPHIRRYLDLAVGLRPPRELYDIRTDPGCLYNLAEVPSHAATCDGLHRRLTAYLEQTGDPRVTGNGDIWETYPRTSHLRWFPRPPWVQTRPSLPIQPWLEQRRPRSKMKAGTP